MPRPYSMADLISRCRKRCDMENHEVIDDDEWAELISEAYGELYMIVFESGMQYFEDTAQLTTDGTNMLTVASTHLSTVALAYVVSTGHYRDLRELMAQERSPMSGSGGGGSARYFSLVEDKIYLYPTPATGQVYEFRYVPQPPELTAGQAATVDVVTPDGLAFLIWSVAVKALAKTEGDPQLAVREREATRGRFMESVQLRALNAPRRRIVSFDFDDDCGERFGW